MKKISLQTMSISELLDLFVEAAVAQFNAELRSDIRKQNQLIKEGWAIVAELKNRAGDQRSELTRLYDHPNVQVRLNAARLSLAIAPTAARTLIQSIADSKKYPQAMDAGMCLWALDQGIFKPT
jgi:hypothetical protein